MSQPAMPALLPSEILDSICANVEDRRDLVSLATTSSTFSSLILPRHTEYRIIRLSDRHPEVWAHLAERADLAANVRRLCIVEDPWLLPHRERFPTTYAALESSGETTEHERLSNIARALRNMTRLNAFIWVQPWASGIWSHELGYHEVVFGALRDLPALKKLVIFDTSDDLRCEHPGLSAIQSMSNLKILGLDGGFWRHTIDLGSTLTNIQELSISLASQSAKLWECKLPQLRKLTLSGGPYLSICSDELVLRFLEAHPSLEELSWYPADQESQLSPGSLPNLKRLETHQAFAMSLLNGKGAPRRSLESLGRLSYIDSSIVRLLGHKLDRSALRELEFTRYDDLETLHRVAETFPALKNLNTGCSSDLDDYVDALSHFLSLEHHLNVGFWDIIQNLSEESRRSAVTKLAERCPLLVCVRGWEQKRQRVVDIHLIRSGEGVTLEERQLYRWCC